MSVPVPRCRLCAALCAIVVLGAALVAPPRDPRAEDNLPPEVHFDILALELDKALDANRHAEIVDLIERLRKTGLPVDPELGYIEARERFALGALTEARTALVAYLNAVGREGKNYQNAIRLYVRIKEKLEKEAAEARRRQAEAEAEAKRLEQARAERARLARIEEERKEQARLARESAEKARLERARAEKRRREAARRKARRRAKVLEALAAVRSEIAGRERRRSLWKERVSTLGGRGDDMIRVLARADGGGFVLGGSFSQPDDPKRGQKAGVVPWLGRIDARGRLIWHRVLGAATRKGAIRSIAALPDGGFVIGGLRDGFRFAARTDSTGTPLMNRKGQPWILVYGRSKGDAGGVVRLGPDGTIYAIGLDTGKAGKDAPPRPFVLRFSTSGKTLNRTVFDRGRDAGALALADALVLADGDVIASGALAPQTGGVPAERGVLMRLTAKGEVAWERRLASDGGGKGDGVRLTALARGPGGRLYAAGRDGNAMLALAFTEDGTTLWRRRIAGLAPVSDRARALCASKDWKAIAAEADDKAGAADELARIEALACTASRVSASATALVARDDGVAVLGIQSRDNVSTNGDIRVAALDHEGNGLWDRVYGHDGLDLPTSGLAAADGGVIIAGATDSAGAGGRDFFMFKLDTSGEFTAWTDLAAPSWAAPRIAPARVKPGQDDGTGEADADKSGGAAEPGDDGAESAVSNAEPTDTETSSATPSWTDELPSTEPPSTTILELFEGVFGSSEPDDR